MNEECDCDEGMAYCESRERCMREERLKDRFECPEVCDVEGEVSEDVIPRLIIVTISLLITSSVHNCLLKSISFI